MSPRCPHLKHFADFNQQSRRREKRSRIHHSLIWYRMSLFNVALVLSRCRYFTGIFPNSTLLNVPCKRDFTQKQLKMDRFTADSKTPICALQVKLHIDTLTPRQKLYALHMSRAAWHGQRIVLAQVSPESPVIFDFLLSYFQGHAENISDQHVSLLLAYSTEFLGNGGNYKSFGDTKFIPPLSIQELDKLVSNHSSADTKSLYAKCRDAMFSLEPTSVRSLGFPDKKACSAYYSANITESEIATVQAFLESKQINAYNTRLFKDDNTAEFTIRLASADRLPTETFSHQGQPIHIAYGDFSDCMSNIVKSIEAAMDFVENDCQLQMLKKYALSFKTGSIDAHKDSQRLYI